MANEDKDRVPAQTGAHPSTSGWGAGVAEAGPRPGVLAVRVWSAAGKRLDCRWSKGGGPVLGVVLDTIRASGGVTGAESPESVAASFADVVTGLLCARRIHWAIQGFGEYEGFRGAAAAILVNAGQAGQQLTAPAAQDWEGVDPGKIVLHGGACDALDGLPGITLGGTTATGWREWAWKPAETNANFATDEQALLGMLHAAGRSDPAVGSAADDSPGAPTRVFTGAAGTGAARRPEIASADLETPSASKFLKMPIVVGAVAAMLIAVTVIFFLTRKSPVQSAAPSAPAAGQEAHPAQVAAPTGPAPVTAQSQPGHSGTPNAQPKHSKLGEMVKKLIPGEQKAPEPAPAPVSTASCGLTDEVIQRSLARADQYLNSGDLTNARASYQHVVGCASAHERAQAGLERIRKMAALNGSPN